MSKKLIVLANSTKHWPDRCVAGRKIIEKDGHYEVGRWIRPINPARKEGALQPSDIMLDTGPMVSVWDFVSISHNGSANDPLQPENIIIDGARWKSLNGLFVRCGLDVIEEKPKGLWLQPDTRTDRISHDYLVRNPPDQTLYCIRPDRLQLEFYTKWDKARRRAVFEYCGVEYDLSLTDPVASDTYCRRIPAASERPLIVEINVQKVLLCVSLAGVLEGFHYKLVATVLHGA